MEITSMRLPLLIATTLALAAALPDGHAQAGEATLSYAGKTVLITGSTDGLGRELARALAADGAHVIVHGRSVERGEALVKDITESGTGSARFHAADFASIEEVRRFARTIAENHPRLDLLVNNAGILRRGEERHTSADGHELQFAINYLAGWILAHELRPALKAAAPSRVVNVASLAAAPIDFADVMLEKPGAAARGYGQSKLAQVTMTAALAPSFANDGITMIAVHPATRMATTMVLSAGVEARTTVDEGRDAVMSLITAATLRPGAFYVGAELGTPHPQASDPDAQHQLAALSTRLTGVPAD
jgi:NAD(P)-dependent dehydrogenase (short-subunit alcohol dehydrogenase family)